MRKTALVVLNAINVYFQLRKQLYINVLLEVIHKTRGHIFWDFDHSPHSWSLLQNKAYMCYKMVIWLTPFVPLNCPRGL